MSLYIDYSPSDDKGIDEVTLSDSLCGSSNIKRWGRVVHKVFIIATIIQKL